MVAVSQEAFFAALKADPRDIMPTIVSGYEPGTGYTSEWRTQNSVQRTLFGKSNNQGYWLVKLPSSE